MYEAEVNVPRGQTLTELSYTSPQDDSTAAIQQALETAFHMSGVAQYLEYNECN